MKSLSKKLIKTSLWNSLAAGINFLTNLLIVKIFGLYIFGELAFIASVAGMFSLVFILLPGNFSIIRYQDDPEYKYLLAAFYLAGSVMIALLSVIFSPMVHLSAGLLFLFSWSLSFQGFFDISLQAENKLNRYYFILFLIAMVKVLFVGLFFLGDAIHNLSQLVLLLALSQGLVMLVMILEKGKLFLKSPGFIGSLGKLLWKEKKLFSGYYFNTALKKLNANILVLLFEPLVTKEVLGLFSLFLKVHQFITGLVRTLESILINKISRQQAGDLSGWPLILLGILTQAGYLVVGMVYLKYLTGDFQLVYLLFLSFTIYPYLFYIKARSRFLIEYNNKPINLSYALFLFPVLLLYGLFLKNPGWNGLNILTISFICGTVLQMTTLVLLDIIPFRPALQKRSP